MALLTALLTRIKKIFLLLFGILKKGFCCRKRCRRNSGMLLPITISVDNINTNKEVIPSTFTQNIPFNNEWNPQNSQLMSKTSFSSNDVKNNFYTNESIVSRNVSVNTNNSNIYNKTEINGTEEQELEPDFFKDMTPEFRKPKKVMIATNQSIDTNKSNRFGVDMKATITQSRELGVIDHFEDGSSWEDNAANEEMWDTDQTLRDMRQVEREKRIAEHQRIKFEKEFKRAKASKANFVATKIS